MTGDPQIESITLISNQFNPPPGRLTTAIGTANEYDLIKESGTYLLYQYIFF